MAKTDLSLLGKGSEYSGKLNFKGTVRIDGDFTGEIISEGSLILGKDAHVEGTVNVGELTVHGSLKGDVCVCKKTILHQSAKVVANISTALLVMEEGAEIQGNLKMGKTVTESMAKVLSSSPIDSVRQGIEQTVKQ